MTCLTELTCAMHADGELSPDEARAVEHHLVGCARCRALVEAHRDENRTLAAAFRESPAGAPLEAVPARPASAWDGRRAGAWGLGLAALAGVSILVGRAGWPDLAGGPGADWVGLLVDLALFVATNAAGLERILTTLALLSMAGLAVAGWHLPRAVTLARRRGDRARPRRGRRRRSGTRRGARGTERDDRDGGSRGDAGRNAGRGGRDRPGRRDGRW